MDMIFTLPTRWFRYVAPMRCFSYDVSLLLYCELICGTCELQLQQWLMDMIFTLPTRWFRYVAPMRCFSYDVSLLLYCELICGTYELQWISNSSEGYYPCSCIPSSQRTHVPVSVHFVVWWFLFITSIQTHQFGNEDGVWIHTRWSRLSRLTDCSDWGDS